MLAYPTSQCISLIHHTAGTVQVKDWPSCAYKDSLLATHDAVCVRDTALYMQSPYSTCAGIVQPQVTYTVVAQRASTTSLM